MTEMESFGDIVKRTVNDVQQDIKWSGGEIKRDGIYADIPLAVYHNSTDLVDGLSVSKSILGSIIPCEPHNGSPKLFWSQWKYNPDRIVKPSTDQMVLGRAVHHLFEGKDSFRKHFVVRPDRAPLDPKRRDWHGANQYCVDWLAAQKRVGLEVLKPEALEIIKIMVEAVSNNYLVKQGLLNGRVERSILHKDPGTGIWLFTRPDVIPAADGVYADLKVTSSLSETFLIKQIGLMGYYLQGAMIRKVCRAIGVPFERFVLFYVLADNPSDCAHVELSDTDLDRGERVINWALKQIRQRVDEDDWPGVRIFDGGERPIQMTRYSAESIDRFLDAEGC